MGTAFDVGIQVAAKYMPISAPVLTLAFLGLVFLTIKTINDVAKGH